MKKKPFPLFCVECSKPLQMDASTSPSVDSHHDDPRRNAGLCIACWTSRQHAIDRKVSPPIRNRRARAARSNDTRKGIFIPDQPGLLSPGELPDFLDTYFGASDPGLWHAARERLAKSGGRVCYYPSAGDDFRPLVYQQARGMARLGLTEENGSVRHPEQATFHASPPSDPARAYHAPDLWIFSDFRGDSMSKWLASGQIHVDDRVQIHILAHTELHPRTTAFRIPPSDSYTSLPPTPMTGRVFFLRLAVHNPTIGMVETDLIYACVENVFFIQRFLLGQRVALSHLVWVRDGAGFGGGRLRHDFLVPLLALFETRWLFLEDRYLRDRKPADYRWPREFRRLKEQLGGLEPDLNAIGSFQSGGDRVVFCEVDSTRPQNALLEYEDTQFNQAMERLETIELNPDPTPSMYLWLRGETWVRLGPFPCLRFDDERKAILDPEGTVVACKEKDHWVVPSKALQGCAFTDPTVKASPGHP